jgi:hypothetical protein
MTIFVLVLGDRIAIMKTELDNCLGDTAVSEVKVYKIYVNTS